MRGRTDASGWVSRHMPISPMRRGSRASSVCSSAMWPSAGMAPREIERERGGGCRRRAHPDHAPTRAEGPHEVGRRGRQRRELPDRGHAVREQLATADQQEGGRDDPGHEGGAARPGRQRVRDAAPHCRRGREPLLGGRASHRGSHLRAPPRLQVADLVVGHEPDAIEVAAAPPDAAVVREVPRPRAERALRATRDVR